MSMQGEALVDVEAREGPKGSYGAGRKMRMRFAAFLKRMPSGDDSLYLTTQEVGPVPF